MTKKETQDNAQIPIENNTVIELFEQLDPEHIPFEKRIFTNRNLRMRKSQLIGFDMDYTLALYHDTIEHLAVELTLSALIKDRGYPEKIRSLHYDPTFAIRGVVIDKRLGNLLKMNHHRHIVRAFHGTRIMGKKERLQAYRNERIRMSAQRYALVDTLFAVPEAWLYANLIDEFEAQSKRSLGSDQYQRIYQDIRETVDRIHADGSLKQRIRADLAHYIEQEPKLANALHRLRSAGKRLFLMINSYGFYTIDVMNHLLEDINPGYPSWQHYFDIIIVGAKKPSFFTNRSAFLQLDEHGEPTTHPVNAFERGVMYQGGNIREFEQLAGASGDQILYVGDNLYGDILRSKKSSNWRTIMVIPEMERELALRTQLADQFVRRDELEAHRGQLDSELQHQQVLLRSLVDITENQAQDFNPTELKAFQHAMDVTRSTIKRLQRAHKRCITEVTGLTERLESSFNKNWGMLFKAWDEHSIFGGQVEDYACMYTSRVSNLEHYSPWRYFRTPRDLMPHEHRAPKQKE